MLRLRRKASRGGGQGGHEGLQSVWLHGKQETADSASNLNYVKSVIAASIKAVLHKDSSYSRTDRMGFVSGSDRPRPMTSSSEYSEVESLSSTCGEDMSV